ncbi:AAA family ATPase [Pseudomonas sp. NY15367]
MYLKKIIIENTGPISNINITPPRDGKKPKPLIIVGENGTGKSILLSNIVNALIVGKQNVYEDVEVEKGKVFKYRSPSYIKSNSQYSYSLIEFDSGEYVKEWQLSTSKERFEEEYGYTLADQDWARANPHETSFFNSTFNERSDSTKSIFEKQCCLYFPVNRFEEPAWLNKINLQSKADYSDLKGISRYSNRELICTSPLKNNINWILDIILDREIYEASIRNFTLPNADPTTPPLTLRIHNGYAGQSNNIFEAINSVIRTILQQGSNVRIGAGGRHNRQIAIMKDNQTWIPNLFQLSTGETQLINLFLSIIRDYDRSLGSLNNLDDISGIVVIDEIDAHLHTSHQREILPQLIKSFPNVQFIITTHSPLFLIGMEELFGEDGFEVINMPNAERISPRDFSEIAAAYEAFKKTAQHKAEIEKLLETSSKPIVFVEGDYDIRYLTKAAELFGRTDLLDRIQFKDGDGFGNLDKVWKGYNSSIAEALPGKVILLYDCDTNKQDTQKGNVYKRVIPSISGNPLSIGIENLLTAETIEKLEQVSPNFIDINYGYRTRTRGVEEEQPDTKSVNRNEKGNMCNWLCEHGNQEDFQHFNTALDIIEEILEI